MIIDVTADFLTRMQNAVQRRKEEVVVKNTKMIVSILEILKKEGFIESYLEDGREVTVTLSYYDDGDPKASSYKKISKPGQRIYVSAKDIVPVLNGRGIGIISTSQGLLTNAQAKSKVLGGEYICKIW